MKVQGPQGFEPKPKVGSSSGTGPVPVSRDADPKEVFSASGSTKSAPSSLDKTDPGPQSQPESPESRVEGGPPASSVPATRATPAAANGPLVTLEEPAGSDQAPAAGQTLGEILRAGRRDLDGDDDGPGNGGGYPPQPVYTPQGPGSGGGYDPLYSPQGPGNGGGYPPVSVPLDDTDGDGPTNGGGYFGIQGVPVDPALKYLDEESKLAEDDGPGSGGGYFSVQGVGSGGGYVNLKPSDLNKPLAIELPTAPEPLDKTEPKPGPTSPRVAGPGSSATLKASSAAEAGSTQSSTPTAPQGPGTSAAQVLSSSWKLAQNLGEALTTLVTGDPMVEVQKELTQVNNLEQMAKALKTPAEFQAKTAEFKTRLAAGEDPEKIRAEAYAVAREAASRTTGMRHYDCQVVGALAMDSGRIAEMKTGEGKTITAVLPLYFNALFGKGAHLVTVNEYLVKEGAEQVRPVLEMLGMKVGVVLNDMSPEQKRDGYNADVTYLSNDTLGFDYLRDRTALNPNQRVQREPFFALVDEVDQVFIDEARVPLIISGQGETAKDEYRVFADVVGSLVPGQDYLVDPEKHTAWLTEVGQEVVANQLAMRETRADLEKAQAEGKSEEVAAAKRDLEQGERIAKALRTEATLQVELDDYAARKPSLSKKLHRAWSSFLGREVPPLEYDPQVRERKQAELDSARSERQELQARYPGYDLYSEENMERVGYLQSALEARGLYREGKDYALEAAASERVEVTGLSPGAKQVVVTALDVNGQELGKVESQVRAYQSNLNLGLSFGPEADQLPSNAAGFKIEVSANGQLEKTVAAERKQELKIVDEFKGRIAEGRRYSNGLHQALEAKEKLEIQPENRTIASITYPVLFRRYPRLAGMSGTAANEQAKTEFRELFGLDVVKIPTNKPVARVDHADTIFRTQKEKFDAVIEHVKSLCNEGVPVLVGTRSVEVNQYLSDQLWDQGVPNQALNAEDVKTNTPEEARMIAQAGMSGVVTVATNMAGRGVDIKPDKFNYKKLAVLAAEGFDQKQPVVVDVPTRQDGERLAAWLASPQRPEDKIPFAFLEDGAAVSTAPGSVQIRVGSEQAVPAGTRLIKAADYPGKKLVVIATERNFSKRIDNQLIGRSGRQGAPGDSYFYLSLDDDLLRVYGSDGLSKVATQIGPEGVRENRAVTNFVDDCQRRVEDAQYSARLNTTKFDQVLNLQRSRIWEFRDQLVNSRPDVTPPAEGERLDVKETLLDWATKAVVEQVKAELGDHGRHKPAQLAAALDKAYGELGFTLDYKPAKKLNNDELEAELAPVVDKLYASLEERLSKAQGLPPGALETFQWSEMIKAVDAGWTDQLEVMEQLKSAANLQAYAEKEPIQAYQEMAYEAFETMIAGMHKQAASRVFSDMLRTVTELDRRSQSSGASPP